MQEERREKLFRLAADGDVEALKEVALELSRKSLAGVNIPCSCGNTVLLTSLQESTCPTCHKRHQLQLLTKSPAPKFEDYGGVRERDTEHPAQCYLCHGWFDTNGVVLWLVDYGPRRHENFCLGCRREHPIYYMESEDMKRSALLRDPDGSR